MITFIESFSLNILRKYLDIENITVELFNGSLLAKKDNIQVKIGADLNSIFMYIDTQRHLGYDVSEFIFKDLAESIIIQFKKPRYRLIYSNNDECWTTIAPHHIHNRMVKYYFGSDNIQIEAV